MATHYLHVHARQFHAHSYEYVHAMDVRNGNGKRVGIKEISILLYRNWGWCRALPRVSAICNLYG